MSSLDVLESTSHVVRFSQSVWIDAQALRDVAEQIAFRDFQVPAWDCSLHFHDHTFRTANWILALDAVNFSFWPDPGQPRWEVEYGGRWYQGYKALAASLKRAVEEGLPVWDAEFLRKLSHLEARKIFRGKGEIPLFQERLRCFLEAGEGIQNLWGGDFTRAIEEARYDAVDLANLIGEAFSSFHDVSQYRGVAVRFYKRAQIVAADLWGSFGGEGIGGLKRIEALTAFADYKVPQVLRRLRILGYAPDLLQAIRNRILLPSGSAWEVEIRANTIWAVELLRQEVKLLGKALFPVQIDWILWNMGQECETAPSRGGHHFSAASAPQRGSQDAQHEPYHHTRSVYY